MGGVDTGAGQVDEMRRAVDGTVSAIDETMEQLDAITTALENSTADLSLYRQAVSIRQRAQALRDRLAPNATRDKFNEAGPPTVSARLGYALYDAHANAYGPTQTQRDALAIATDAYQGALPALRQLQALEDTVEGSKGALVIDSNPRNVAPPAAHLLGEKAS